MLNNGVKSEGVDGSRESWLEAIAVIEFMLNLGVESKGVAGS